MTIRIFIDQGHNPGIINAGASANGLEEQAITFIVGSFLADLLDGDPRFAVRTSRMYPAQVLGNTTTQSLHQRVDMANGWPADYFISIHANSNPNPALNGSEIYIFQRGGIAYDLAQDVLAQLVTYAGTRDNEVRVNPSLYVLRATRMPAILVELAYLTNLMDALRLTEDPYAFAYGIYIGILTYFGFALPQPLQQA